MADNFLERKFEELESKKKIIVRRSGISLDSLLKENRSCRGFDNDVTITQDQLRRIIGTNMFIASGMNRQVLRFRPVTKSEDSDKVLEAIKIGGALPDLHLPIKGTEPKAFIIIMSTDGEDRMTDIDMGISLQTMGLKAVEMGLNVLIIGSVDRKRLKEELNLPLEPLMVMAVGKGIEKIYIKPISAKEDHRYYRKDGIHFVPKIRIEELIV